MNKQDIEFLQGIDEWNDFFIYLIDAAGNGHYWTDGGILDGHRAFIKAQWQEAQAMKERGAPLNGSLLNGDDWKELKDGCTYKAVWSGTGETDGAIYIDLNTIPTMQAELQYDPDGGDFVDIKTDSQGRAVDAITRATQESFNKRMGDVMAQSMEVENEFHGIPLDDGLEPDVYIPKVGEECEVNLTNDKWKKVQVVAFHVNGKIIFEDEEGVFTLAEKYSDLEHFRPIQSTKEKAIGEVILILSSGKPKNNRDAAEMIVNKIEKITGIKWEGDQ